MARNARYAAKISYFVDYWERMHREITSLLPSQLNKLQEGFWLISDWRKEHARSCLVENGPTHSADLTPEDDLESYPFCNPAKERLRPNFNPYHDILFRDFVLNHPSHNNHLHVWLGCTLTCMDNTPGENYGWFIVEWQPLMKRKREGKRALAKECWIRQ